MLMSTQSSWSYRVSRAATRQDCSSESYVTEDPVLSTTLGKIERLNGDAHGLSCLVGTLHVVFKMICGENEEVIHCHPRKTFTVLLVSCHKPPRVIFDFSPLSVDLCACMSIWIV